MLLMLPVLLYFVVMEECVVLSFFWGEGPAVSVNNSQV